MPRSGAWEQVPLKTKLEWTRRYKNGEILRAEAESLDWEWESLRREINRFWSYYRQFTKDLYLSASIPESPSKVYSDYPVINTDDAIIIGDTEIPDHNAMMLKLALLVGMKRGIKRLIHAGDIMATDQQGLNSWVTSWNVEGDTTFERATNLTNDILHDFSKWFEDTDIIEGNHDKRVANATGGNVHLGMLLKHSRVRYSRYAYLYMQTSERGLIKVVHPQNFSSDPVTLGQQLYDVERGPDFDPLRPVQTLEKCHFVIAHCHRVQYGMSKDGAYEINSIGTTRDAMKTQYKAQNTNKHRQWDYSFLAVDNGYFHTYNLIGTNWREELGELYKLSPLAQAR